MPADVRCTICAAVVPPVTTPGPPRRFCNRATTGRPCRRFWKAILELRVYADHVKTGSETAQRDQAQYRMIALMRESILEMQVQGQ